MSDERARLEENLTAYLDGELPPAQVQELEAALAKDPALRALKERLQRAIGAVAALPSPEASPALRRAVLTGAEAPPSLAERVAAFFTLPRLAPLAGVAAAVGVAVVVARRGGSDNGAEMEQLALAHDLDVLDDYDVIGLESADDVDVVLNLKELEALP